MTITTDVRYPNVLPVEISSFKPTIIPVNTSAIGITATTEVTFPFFCL